MPLGATADRPSAWWRAGSSATMFEVGALCRAFLFAACTVEVNGLEEFIKLLDSRQDPSKRTRGLVTVANHISVLDDPLMWGVLPLRYHFNLPSYNHRWAFGSHDICFKNRLLSAFFTLGQVLPTHRLAYSPHGGLFQPTMTQAIRLLSKGPFPADPHAAAAERQRWSLRNVCVDPFSDLPTAYTTTCDDSFLAPSAYACNSYSWIHIFPEGKIHQSPQKIMRYFKWGVSRLILEPEECPDVVPIWLEGTDEVMHESRGFPRFLPRPFKKISVTFGEKADTEAVFGDLRRRWQELKAKAVAANPSLADAPPGVLSEDLMYGQEAVELRKECTRKVRDLVLEVRRSRGLPDEDPKASLVDTWIQEGPKKEGHMKDESWNPPIHWTSGGGALDKLALSVVGFRLDTFKLATHCVSPISNALPQFSMPKKHNKYPSVKPVNTVHPSLISSSNDRHRHGGSGSRSGSSASQERSVNDLIQHLRRTQVSRSANGEGSMSSSSVFVPKTVHPSIRNLLELPETLSPRPRANARSAIGRRLRRTPGPLPPSSWLAGSSSDSERKAEQEGIAVDSGRVLYRLERLPGVTFPSKRSLQHTVLMSMARNWTWHLDYDGTFLAELPNRMKMLLLSYIAVYSRDLPLRTRMQGLHPLFTKLTESEDLATEPEITRLDLSGAIGQWISLKQLNNELVISRQHEAPRTRKLEEVVPSSWDAESDSESSTTPSLLLKSPTQTLRFENLRFLSLAHPDPASASWSSLLNLLSHISTLTHLSLAHWPVPTLAPKSITARTRLSLVSASGVLRKLSRATYCLKWLDLEGCGEWFDALCWDGIGEDGEVYNSPGPEWTGSWRDVEWVGLGPGWLPEKSSFDDESTGFPVSSLENGNARPLAASIHAPAIGDNRASFSDPALARDVEAEQTKYRQAKEMEAYENVVRKAREVEKHVHCLRKESGGKWVHFSFGGDSEEERTLLDRTMKRIDRAVDT